MPRWSSMRLIRASASVDVSRRCPATVVCAGADAASRHRSEEWRPVGDRTDRSQHSARSPIGLMSGDADRQADADRRAG